MLLMLPLCSCKDEVEDQENVIPDYCIDNVQKQIDALRYLTGNGVSDMLYITDTHYADNSLDSPHILSYLARNGLVRRFIWGGDAISSYGDITTEWEDHQRDFLGSVVPYGRYYMVRGNHEFTSRDKTDGNGTTYTQPQTATMLYSHSEPDVVRPADDPEACYYYFDDPECRLRYCVFDTTDSIVSPSSPWSTLAHTSQRQLDWMDRNALHNVPDGYQLVIVTHIGIIPETYVPHAPFDRLEQLVEGAGAPVLMVVSGHRHQDFQTYSHGILHVLTGSDALYPDLQNSPFLHNVGRRRGTSSAPLMDLFSFADDRKTVHAIRIGAGFSRTFHLEALSLDVSEVLPLPETTSFSTDDAITWTSYDATGYSCIDASWDPPRTVLDVASDGSLHPLREGEAVLMASNSKGQKEFFNVIVRESITPEDSAVVETGLPVVLINTTDLRPVSSRDEWMEGATMRIMTSPRNVEYQGTLSIKGRGNTSWGFPKKPYALKLDQKASLLGMPEHRRWCLLANWADRSLIRNAVAFELARQTELDWTPSGRHVELILNGQHLGNYYLCERVGIDENRLDIADPKEPEVDRGYLLELDTYFDEEYKFHSAVKGLPYQFKDPSVVTPEQQDFTEHYVAEMEDALYDSARFAARDFAELMDLESFADYWLIYEIAQLWEPNHPKSVFMHKDAGGKMKAGPVWDFDMGCFKPRPSYFFVNKNAFYYQQLFRDREFCLLLRSRLDAYRDKFLSVGTYIDELGERLYPSQCINYPMWPIKIDSSGDETIDDYSEVIARIRQAITEKINWLDENL